MPVPGIIIALLQGQNAFSQPVVYDQLLIKDNALGGESFPKPGICL